MMKLFSLCEESEMHQWDDFVNSHPEGTPFHLSCWMRTIQDTYSFEPLLYVHTSEGGNILGVLPFFFVSSIFTGSRIVSLPFSDYCGPLFVGEGQELPLLGEVIKEHKARSRYVEIRSNLPGNCGFIRKNYYMRHILELPSDPSKLLEKVDKRTIQRCIKRAQARGVEVREDNGQAALEQFCRLNRLTRKKHGLPPQPKRFFENFFDLMISGGNAFILLGFYQSEVISAGVFLKLRDTVYYKYNASNPEFLSSVTPNHLLTWYAIRRACSEGYRFFDFGRTSLENFGLARHKRMWGAKVVDLPYYYYPEPKGPALLESNILFCQVLRRLWRLLPDPIVNAISSRLYRHAA